MSYDFTGTGETMSEGQVAYVAQQLGLQYADIRCILDVETNGTGFDNHKRPKMLFEPYHFWKNIPQALRPEAIARGIATSSRPRSYPAESYTRIADAIDFLAGKSLPPDAALMSASWGIGQVMGENHAMCGYPTVTAMIEECKSGEEGQLRVMVGYLKGDYLIPAIKAHDWATVERGYNGAGAHGVYAAKLIRDYARLSKLKAPKPVETDAHVTPLPVASDKPVTIAPQSDIVVDAQKPPQNGLGMPASTDVTDAPTKTPEKAALPQGVELPAYIIKAAQDKLRALGYFAVGVPNGKPGSWTAGAITSFQVDNGLPKTGEFDQATLYALDSAKPRPIDEGRFNTTIKDLRNAGSVIVTKADKAKTYLLFQMGGGGLLALLSSFSDWFGPSWHKLDDVRTIFGSVPNWAWATVAVGLAAVSYYFVHQTQQARVDAEKVGMFTAVAGSNIPAVPDSLPPTQELVRGGK